jgi:hypothetical protein
MQPTIGSQESVVQGLKSSHTTAGPEHAAFWHVSPAVQALPSSHGIPLCELVGWQTLPAQASPSVQGFPSSQAVPGAFHSVGIQNPISWQSADLAHDSAATQGSPSATVLMQPCSGLHTALLQGWSAMAGSHSMGSLPTQTPASQVDAPVH